MTQRNGNGLLKKIAFWAITTLLGASGYGYVSHVSGQIDTLNSKVEKAVSSDSLKSVEHENIPMHDGAKEAFNKNELRYVRDSAETAHHRDETVKSLSKIDSAISNLTRWLMDNTNNDSANGRP